MTQEQQRGLSRKGGNHGSDCTVALSGVDVLSRLHDFAMRGKKIDPDLRLYGTGRRTLCPTCAHLHQRVRC